MYIGYMQILCHKRLEHLWILIWGKGGVFWNQYPAAIEGGLCVYIYIYIYIYYILKDITV